MSTYVLSLAYSIEVFSLDNEDDDDVMHDLVADKVRDAGGCPLCGDEFDRDGIFIPDLPAAAYIACPLPRTAHGGRRTRAGAIWEKCVETMTEREIDKVIAERAPRWAADDAEDGG
jgi:hypothetical protein